jgi:hypothetical protein
LDLADVEPGEHVVHRVRVPVNLDFAHRRDAEVGT